jgi:hypothetical protein
MTLPSIIIGFAISSFYGAFFHFLRGGNLSRLILYLLLAWIGFWAGHFVGDAQSWLFLSIGPLHLGCATIGSILLLVIGNWLSLVDTGKRK